MWPLFDSTHDAYLLFWLVNSGRVQVFAPKERECAAAWAVSGLFAGNFGFGEVFDDGSRWL